MARAILYRHCDILQHHDGRQRIAEIFGEFKLSLRPVRVTLGKVQGAIYKDTVLADAINLKKAVDG